MHGIAGIDKTGEVIQLWHVSGYTYKITPDLEFVQVRYYCDSKKEAEAFADKVAKFNFVEGVSYLIEDDNTSNWVFKG